MWVKNLELLKNEEIEHHENKADHDSDMLSHANNSVKDVIQGILDQLLLLEKFVDLKSFNKLEKLNKLDHLEDLNYLKFIPNLKKELEDLNERLPLLASLDELGKLEPVYLDLKSLDQSLQEVVPRLEKFDKLDELKELSELSKLEELHHLKALQSLDQLVQLEQMNELQQLESLKKLKSLENLNQLENLKLLKKIDQFEKISKGINLSALDKLDKLDILKQERSKIWGALIIKMMADTTRTLVVAGGLVFAFFYFAQKKEMITLTQSLLSMDAHTVNISYGLLDRISPLGKSEELQRSFYNKSMFEVVNYWNNESFNKHTRLLSLNFIYTLNKDIIPAGRTSPVQEFEVIQNNEMKSLDSVIKALPEQIDSDMVSKAYFSRLFMDIHSGNCKDSMDSLKSSHGPNFITLENRLRAQALFCLFKESKYSMTETLKKL